MITYTTDITSVTAEMLDGGFFVGWPNPPSPATHLRILQGSYLAWLAIDTTTNKVVGFINAVSDGVLSAYIPLLEVLPEYQGKGIGRQLVAKAMDSLKHLYMIDVLCDENVLDFYTRCGMHKATGAIARNHDRQSGS